MKNSLKKLVSLSLALLLGITSVAFADTTTVEAKNLVLWDMIRDDVDLLADECGSSELHTLYVEGSDQEVAYADPELEGQYLHKVLKILDAMVEASDHTTCLFGGWCDHVECIGTNVVLVGPWSDWTYRAEENLCRERSRLVIVVCSDCDEFVIATEYNDDCEHAPSLASEGWCEDCGFFVDAPMPVATIEVFPQDEKCAHRHTTVDETHGSWEAVKTADTCRVRTITTTVVCTKCGKTLSTEKSKEYDHVHSFEGRTCTKCGYKIPLEEGEGTAPGTVEHQPTETVGEAPDQGELQPLGEGEGSAD